MSTYFIGDVQGCYQALLKLLDKINYEPSKDILGFAGDLVNRGPQSLETLRFIKSLPNARVVLGNHDLYLLMIAYGAVDYDGPHTLDDILQAPDKQELLEWLRQQPLIFQQDHYLMVHAGIPPQWRLAEVIQHAKECSSALQSDQFFELLSNLEGDQPKRWHNQLHGNARLRYIVNAFTRMRVCKADGELEFSYKGDADDAPKDYQAWFDWPLAVLEDVEQIYFGHWAARAGHTGLDHIIALDTGCVWGGKLTAVCVETGERFSV